LLERGSRVAVAIGSRKNNDGGFHNTTLNCHGPRTRATQAIIRLIRRADARLLGGPVKPGHDPEIIVKP
jgi:hypothetical protein